MAKTTESALPDHKWFLVSDESSIDLALHIHSPAMSEVLRIGPGVDGRWWLLLGPGEPTLPHDHQLSNWHANPNHPARCTSHKCWNGTRIGVDGKLVTLRPDDDDYPKRVADVAGRWRGRSR